jgi:SAM-dependent methyltransferase
MSARNKAPTRAERINGRPRAGSGLYERIPRLVEAWRKRRRSEDSGPLTRREIALAGSSLLELQRGLTGDRYLAGSGYMEDPDLLGAYLLYYWPVSYMQVSLALAEFPLARASERGPYRILDLGSGPGPASAAILDTDCDARGGTRSEAPELVLADASRAALDLASSILERGPAAPVKAHTVALNLESSSPLPEGPFDLVVAGHCLNELWRGKPEALDRRESLLRRAAERLAPGGRILVLEPSLLSTSRELIALRDRLATRSWRVIGPCPGSYPCPILAAGPERSCHAESSWQPPEIVAVLAAAAGLDRDSVKFAYFFLEPDFAEGGGNSAPDCLRVVSDPMLNKAGRLRYHLCGEKGLVTISAKADDTAARAAGFMSLGRGDLVRPTNFEKREGGGLGFCPLSRLELVRRAPEASKEGRL